MKSSISLLFLLAIIFSNNLLIAQDCEKLIWSDEFDGDALDLTKWNYDIGNGCPNLCNWGNNEQQYYTDATDNVSVANGFLTITAKEDNVGGMDYSSGRIHTKNKADFRFGRVETRAKLPETQGLWPAIWMLSTDNVYGEWPRSGEIDIMELLGHKPNEVLGTIHTGLPWTFTGNSYSLGAGESFADDFHTFSLEWDADTIKWFVDDIQYHQVTQNEVNPWSPFQEDFHIILNIAVGGNLPGFPDATTVLPQTMEVDYVRVYSSPAQLNILGSQPIPGQKGVIYNTFEIADAEYVWTTPSGSSITSGQGTAEITVDWGCVSGDVQLELRTDCDTVFLYYEVTNFDPIAVEGTTTVEQNQANLIYSVPEALGAVYTWYLTADGSITSGQGTNSITVDWACEAGDVIIDGMSDCGFIEDTISVALRNYAISGFAIVVPNAMNEMYSIDQISDATYFWNVPTDATISSGQGTHEITVDFGIQPGDISVDITNSCGTETYTLPIELNNDAIYCNFDGTELDWPTFGGSVFEKIENPFISGINTSAHIGKTRKDPGSQDWAGIFADLGGEMDLSENSFMHMKVYAPKTGIVKFKLEDITTAADPVELNANMNTTNEWVNLIWDFTGASSDTYDRIALFFDFGSVDTSYWYFDDVFGLADGPSGVIEAENNSIQVYPNPSKGIFIIDSKDLFKENNISIIEILSTDGKVVYQEKNTSPSNSINLNLSHLSNGTYFLKLGSKNLQYIKKIIIANP